MQEQLTAIENFLKLAARAATRGGAAFVHKMFEIGHEGKPTLAKGTVYVDGTAEKKIPLEMIWSMEGKALLLGPAYDLVDEEAFEW